MSEKRTILIAVELPATANDRSIVSGLSSYVARFGGTVTGWAPGGSRRFFERAARIGLRRATR